MQDHGSSDQCFINKFSKLGFAECVERLRGLQVNKPPLSVVPQGCRFEQPKNCCVPNR